MPQENGPGRFNAGKKVTSPQARLKGSVLHYDRPFEPVDIECWEADMLEPNNTERLSGIPTHIAPSGTRYVRISEVPRALQDSFERYLTGAGCPVVDNEDGPLAFETDWIEWRQHRRPDRIAAHNNVETSAALMRALPTIASKWALPDTDLATLLGINIDSYREWLATPLQAGLTAEQLERAFNFLEIYRSLTLLFPRGEQQQKWLHHDINIAPFNGLTPLELMSSGGLSALRSLRGYLDAQR